ncbi:MAG: hypothetical protein K0U40_07245 [Betaproteobacteria bacterium]|nr:hypothetical protein [Betaproteobacteria bacterium]
MKNIQSILQLIILMLLLTFVSSPVFSKDSALKFKATITEIERLATGDSQIIVSLISDSSDFDIPLTIKADTKIGSNGQKISLSELETGDYIEVRAFFSVAGIVAEEIEFYSESCYQFDTRVATYSE